MDPKRPLSWHAAGIVVGLVALGIRLLAIFAVIGTGYYVYVRFGTEWFRVFVFAAIAASLHLDIRRIEREYPPDHSESGRDA